MEFLLIVAVCFVGFMLSASAGMGGSLILVPLLASVYGTKEGIALAALLLASNNVFKVIAYRKSVPLKASLVVIILTILGAWVGAGLLLKAPDSVVQAAVIVVLVGAFLLERLGKKAVSRKSGLAAALTAGMTSGFSGTSGPLKGVALRSISLNHLALVGAASLVSLAGDLIKASVYSSASLFTSEHIYLIVFAIPLMPVATWSGRSINRRLGERFFGILFWSVMAGYSIRLIIYAVC